MVVESRTDDLNYSDDPWIAKVITLYPEMFPGTLGYSVIGRAHRANIWSLEIINLRDFVEHF